MNFLTHLRPCPLDHANSAFGLKQCASPCGTRPYAKMGAQEIHRASPGTCGFGYDKAYSRCFLRFSSPIRKFRQATEDEGEAFRMSEARRASFRNVPRTTEPAVKNFRRVPFLGHLSWARKKGEKEWE